jgi:hypothetical protein
VLTRETLAAVTHVDGRAADLVTTGLNDPGATYGIHR